MGWTCLWFMNGSNFLIRPPGSGPCSSRGRAEGAQHLLRAAGFVIFETAVHEIGRTAILFVIYLYRMYFLFC